MFLNCVRKKWTQKESILLSGSTSYPKLHTSSPVSNTLKFFLTRKFLLQNNFNETFADLSCTFGGVHAEVAQIL